MKYKYLYQDHENVTHEEEISARNRAEVYTILRKRKIRPFRVIGDDPWNWRPWAISAGYIVLSIALIVLGVVAISQARQIKELQMSEIDSTSY